MPEQAETQSPPIHETEMRSLFFKKATEISPFKISMLQNGQPFKEGELLKVIEVAPRTDAETRITTIERTGNEITRRIGHVAQEEQTPEVVERDRRYGYAGHLIVTLE